MGLKTPHCLTTEEHVFTKPKKFHEKHMLPTDDLVHPGNCRGTSCPLWPEQSKHPIFNTMSDPHAHDPSPQANNQSTDHTFHCKEIIKGTLEGK